MCIYMYVNYMSHIPTVLYVCICMYVSMCIYISYMYVCSITQPCPTLCNPMDCSLAGSSVHEIFQARILERVAISYSGDLLDIYACVFI